MAYTLANFAPTTPEAFEQSQRILAFVRIPHHTRIDRWLDPVAGLQLAWIAVGLFLLRRTRLFPVLAVAAFGGLALSVAQWLSGNATFALLFPWRISTLLVPVASAAVVWRAITALPASPRILYRLYVPLFAASVAGGLVIAWEGWGYAGNEAERDVTNFARTANEPGDVYLLPVRIPAVGSGPRGSVSTSFTPPPRPKPGSNLIPVDLQRFRLQTGAPIYVDFKAIPYKDVEVLEWLRRMEQCRRWYDGGWGGAATRAELKVEGVTHVVLPAGQAADAAWLECVHRDDAYAVYRVR